MFYFLFLSKRKKIEIHLVFENTLKIVLDIKSEFHHGFC